MTITINLPNVDKPDKTIDAKHIILVAEQENEVEILFKGKRSTCCMAEQLSELYKSLKEQMPMEVALAHLLLKVEEKEQN